MTKQFSKYKPVGQGHFLIPKGNYLDDQTPRQLVPTRT
jgi:hypothetical protein